MRQEILVGAERRRRWSVEQKLRILAEVGVDDATVSDVARRYDITRQHLYQWRSWLRRHPSGIDDGIRFLPVERVDDQGVQSGFSGAMGDGRVEILLRNGRSIGVTGDPPDALLARIIRIAETA